MTTPSVVSHRSTTTRRTPPEHHRAATEVPRNSGHPQTGPVVVFSRQPHCDATQLSLDTAGLGCQRRAMSSILQADSGVIKLDPHLKPLAHTRGSIRPAGRVDVFALRGIGGSGVVGHRWIPL